MMPHLVDSNFRQMTKCEIFVIFGVVNLHTIFISFG